jgi:hypothetical protein
VKWQDRRQISLSAAKWRWHPVVFISFPHLSYSIHRKTWRHEFPEFYLISLLLEFATPLLRDVTYCSVIAPASYDEDASGDE